MLFRSVSVAKAFKKVYSYRNTPLIWPKVLQVDGGSEFRDKVCKVMGKKGVRIRVGSTHKHQSIVERFNRTLAERLFRIQDAIEFITEIEDTKWVENLQDIVDDLNNSITRLIGMSPAIAILKDEVFALPSKIPKHRVHSQIQLDWIESTSQSNPHSQITKLIWIGLSRSN